VKRRGIPEEKQDDFLTGNQFVIPLVFLGSDDSYKIDYSAVVVKSRCVARK
jgi:hypothetical protein